MRFFGLLILAGMAALSYRQSRAWQSEESLWSQAVAVSPLMPRPHLALGFEYQRQGRITEAIEQFERATALSQDSRRMASHQRLSRVEAKNNLALMALLQGDAAESLRISSEVLEEAPNYRNAMINQGTAYLALGNCRAAVNDYIAAGIWELPKCQ